MGKAVRIDEFVDGREDVLVARDIGEGRRAVLLDPGKGYASVTGEIVDTISEWHLLPWQAILCFDRQVSGTPFAFGSIV